MKKGVLLSLAAFSAVCFTAHAAEIDVQLALRKVQVKATDTDNVSIPSIQLLNADKTEMLYADEGENENGTYIFESFSFPESAPSGEYILRLGENGKITELPIKYTSYSEAAAMLEKIKNDKSEILPLLSANPEFFGISGADYEIFTDAWKQRLKAELSELEIKYESESETEETIQKLCEVSGKITLWAKLTSSKNAADIEKAAKAIGSLDAKYTDNLKSFASLNAAFNAQNIDVLNVDESGIISAFDGAVLVCVINECDWGTGKAALSYYCEKGLLNISSKYLNAGADVYKQLKNKGILDYRKLPEELEKLCSSANSSDAKHSGSGGGGGGGTSIGKVNTAGAAVGTMPQEEVGTKVTFSDLESVSWAKEAVEALAEKKIVSGRENGKFEPNDNLTRAEFVKLIVCALGLSDSTAQADFDDVSKDSRSYSYIASAKKAGIINGITDNYFGAAEPVKRQDMAVILMRALGSISAEGGAAEFTDFEEISPYARDAALQLAAAGIINGMGDGTFSPNTYVTRAQGAKVIYEMLLRKESGR